jgi:tetratricopeptide (TPR) repeat protein
LTKAIEIQPMWPPPHTNLANLYLAQGKKQEAIDKFEGALDTNPGDAAAYLSLAQIYERGSDFQNAMDVYERALKQNPNFWVAANNLAFLLSEHSDRSPDRQRAVTLAKDAAQRAFRSITGPAARGDAGKGRPRETARRPGRHGYPGLGLLPAGGLRPGPGCDGAGRGGRTGHRDF